MRVKNLGELKGELTVFGGAYSNAQAMQALLDQSSGTLICTGDVVAYCGAPNEVIEITRRAQIHVAAGNCEKQLAASAQDCGCGFEDGTTCDVLSAGWYAFANNQIRMDAREWMSRLPDVLTFTHSGRRFAVIHGGVTEVARFIWSTSDDSVLLEERDALTALCGDIDVIIAGHSGIAFERRVEGIHWVNAGVIGMPPHDGAQQTEYLRVTAEGTFEFERLTYDVAGAVSDMTRAGLTQGYHISLQTGVWPSEDVLPLELRRYSSSFASG